MHKTGQEPVVTQTSTFIQTLSDTSQYRGNV